MQIQWYGQAAFRLEASEATVFIDPFGDLSQLAQRLGVKLDYPPIEDVSADLVLVTHEHGDHNGVEVIQGSPAVLRSTAGRLNSPIGDVVAIASEHDAAAGTERGPNTIFVLTLDGTRIAHFGDFGQRALRDEQAAAIGAVDLVFLPVGAGPTIGPEQAQLIVERLDPRWVVPMHYRTEKIGFLEPVDPFLERMPHVVHAEGPVFDPASLDGERPLVVVPAVP
ncbi:MAG TPA: MBL fold metallo-hydrolase [Solirubrobacteraceae bacterium]|nr:MBL fold metallo-hydrolase [Solirubrobacteraceae bacterium]